MGVRTAVRKRTPLQSRQEILDALYLCQSLRQSDPAGTLRMALDISGNAEQAGHNDLQAQAFIRCAEASFQLGRDDDTAAYLRRAEDLLCESGPLRERMFLYQGWGIYYKERGEPLKAYDYLHRVLELCVTAEHRPYKSRTLNTLGNLFAWTGNYDTALSYLFECLELAEQDRDDPMIRVVLGGIGAAYSSLEDYHRALEYQQRALAQCIDANDMVGVGDELKNIGVTCSMLENNSRAIEYFERALEVWRKIGSRKKEADVLSNIASIHAESGDLTAALSYIREAVQCARDSKDTWEYAYVLSNLGWIHRLRKEHDRALAASLRSLRLYRKLGLRKFENDERQNIAKIHEERGDYRRSLQYQQEYLKVRDQLLGAEMQRSVVQLEVRRTLKRVEEEKEMLRRLAEQTRIEMEKRVRELNALTVDLTERNEALRRIRNEIEPLLRATEEPTRRNAARIARQIDGMNAEGKRNLFQEQFEHVYREFIRQLRAIRPDLTPAEIRICVLIKLNLSNKQIAEILFASPLTVKTHRARIRRKLGLGKGESLSSILIAM